MFIYNKTDLSENEWWVILLLKKGPYSCLIILMWYCFCYDIFYVHELVEKDEDHNKYLNWQTGCGLAFSIIFGIVSLFFHLFSKIYLVVL